MSSLPVPGRTRWLARSGGALLFAAALFVSSAGAVERVLELVAPAAAVAKAKFEVALRTSTDAGDKEQIGFLQVEVSTDGGKTWKGFCYDQNLGISVSRQVPVEAGAAGTTAIVRARVAFRGGAAGDVDYRGGAIKWDGTWAKWVEPPARVATIEIKSR